MEGAVTCERCSGRMLRDPEDGDLVCMACGRGRERPWEPSRLEAARALGKRRVREPSHQGLTL